MYGLLVQEALNQRGYDCGNVDGVCGQKTIAQISAYQSTNGLSVTGVINDQLLRSWGLSDSVTYDVKRAAAKEAYHTLSWQDLARYLDNHKGERLRFSGTVL